MKININIEQIAKIISYLLLLFFIIIIVLGLFEQCNNYKDYTSSPVEELRIDSLNKVNRDLIIEIETLDSIKNEIIVEVKSLDNDSTLKLFYKLIGK